MSFENMMLNDKNIALDQYLNYESIYDRVVEMSDIRFELLEKIRQRRDGFNGEPLLWDDRLRFRTGEITVWAGVNSSGKSLILGQIMLNLINQYKKVMIASLEMPAEDTLDRIAQQFCRNKYPTESQIDAMFSWRQDYFYIFNFVGSINKEKIIALCRYAKRIGCDHIVIDSLMKCTGDDDDLGVQKGIVNSLTEVAKEVKIHIHLVHHARKGTDTLKAINKYDIKGSGAIADLAHNLVLIHRNLQKEENTKVMGVSDNSVPDQILFVIKQRNGEKDNFEIPLWYHDQTLSYTKCFEQLPVNYLGV
jgi:twinkle protein